jgi:uncharacterized SAM-binding protein YcdF (DUF218 family)
MLSRLVKWVLSAPVAFLILAIIGLLLLSVAFPRARRRIAVAIALIAAGCLAFSLPWVARRLARPLYRFEPLTTVEQAHGASTIALLHGDNLSLRVAETLRVYKLLAPRLVLVIAPGPDVRATLIQSDEIPPDTIVWAHRSVTTREQALELAGELRTRGVHRVVLIASPLHMPRALAACRMAGVDAQPAVTAAPDASFPSGAWSIVPRRQALRVSYDALYEHLALRWYRLKGWT